MTRIRICCATCGSTMVTRDATAAWDEHEQCWSLAGVQDQGYCETCGDVELVEVPIQQENAA